MVYTPTSWVNGTGPFINADNLNKIEQGIADAHLLIPAGGSTIAYEMPLSSFSGADDDAKLTTAMSHMAQQTYKGGTIVLDEDKQYTFSTKQPLYSGFSIRGSSRPTDQLRAASSTSNKVRVRTSGGWFYLNQSQTFSCSFQGLSIDGTSSTRLLDGHSSNVLWTSVFRDNTSVNAANVLGSESQRLLVTACLVDGFWNVNNTQDSAFVLGGSDFYFNPSMMLLDAGGFLTASDYIFRSEYLSNSWISNIYITAEGHRAFSLSGSNTGSVSNWIQNCVIEGRNENDYSPGALVRCSGGQHILRDNRYAFAMGDVGTSDGGAIHVTGGHLSVLGGTYQRATGVGTSVPFVYASGGKVRIRDIVGTDYTSTKPIAYQTTEGLIDADDSVTVQTA